MTDFWKPYEHFVPNDIYIQSKAETYTVEGHNSFFRHFLARLRRKAKCYSKSKKMALYSLLHPHPGPPIKREGNIIGPQTFTLSQIHM